MRGPKFTYAIRLVAAAYIIYLAVSMIHEIQKGAVTGGMLVLGIVGIAAFFGFAVWAAVTSVRGFMTEQASSENETAEETEAHAEEEEKARIIAAAEGTTPENSLFARMERMNAGNDESSEEEDG